MIENRPHFWCIFLILTNVRKFSEISKNLSNLGQEMKNYQKFA